jgi:hypothetical protein
MYRINPDYQNIQINLNSDDDAVHSSELQSDSDLFFQFNRTITIPPNYNLNLSINQLEIPHSFYTFDEDIWLTVSYPMYQPPTIPFNVQVLIPKGFYSVSSLKKKVSDVMKASTNTPKPPQWNLTDVTFNPATLKWYWSNNADAFKFQWSANSARTVELQVDTLQMIKRFFGMPVEYTSTWTSSTVGGIEQLASVNVADCTRYHNLYISTGDWSTGSVDSNNSASESVLAKIPVNAPFGSIINYKGNPDDGYLYQMRSFNQVSLSLRGHRGKLIQLNGGRFNISLLVQFIKREVPLQIPTLPIAQALPVQNSVSKESTFKKEKKSLKSKVKRILRKRTKQGA